MSVKIPDSHLDLLTGPVVATFTTVSPQGAPENTVVWCSYDGEYVLVNTAEGRRKPANVRNNPHVALTVIDPKDDYRWIDVRGIVEAIVPDENNANIDAHARLYAGVDRYYGGFAPAERAATEQRLILKIRPQRLVFYPRA